MLCLLSKLITFDLSKIVLQSDNINMAMLSQLHIFEYYLI